MDTVSTKNASLHSLGIIVNTGFMLLSVLDFCSVVNDSVVPKEVFFFFSIFLYYLDASGPRKIKHSAP